MCVCGFRNPYFPVTISMQHPFRSCQNNTTDNLRTRSMNCFRCFSLSFPSTRCQSPGPPQWELQNPAGRSLCGSFCISLRAGVQRLGHSRRRTAASLKCVPILPSCVGLGRSGRGSEAQAQRRGGRAAAPSPSPASAHR